MSFSKLVVETGYKSIYVFVTKLCDANRKIQFSYLSRASNAHILLLYKQVIGENKMIKNSIWFTKNIEKYKYVEFILNKKYFDITNSNLYLNMQLKNINYDNIPLIKYYSYLIEALYTSDGNMDNPLNLPKKIYSIFDAVPAAHQDVARKDLETISDLFYHLLTHYVKEPVVKMKNKGNSTGAVRNAFCHDNYYTLSMRDGLNLSCFNKLIENLSPEELKKLYANFNGNDWVIWNIDSKLDIKYCYIIEDEKLRVFMKEFKGKCDKIIKNSKRNEKPDSAEKLINDKNIAQLNQAINDKNIAQSNQAINDKNIAQLIQAIIEQTDMLMHRIIKLQEELSI